MKKMLTVLLLISLILSLLTMAACQPAETEPEEATLSTTANGKDIVQKVGPVEASWFDDAVMVGDSITLKLCYYCEENPDALGKIQFFCSGSLSYNNALWDIDDPDAVHPVYEGETTLTEYCAEKTGASKVFIMLGMNDIGLYGVDGALSAAQTLTDNILAHSEHASIYIQSVTPIVKGCEYDDLNNKLIRAFNEKLKSFAEENGFMYLDLYSLFADENGYLKDEYCSDKEDMGIHFTDTACAMWADYLKENV